MTIQSGFDLELAKELFWFGNELPYLWQEGPAIAAKLQKEPVDSRFDCIEQISLVLMLEALQRGDF